MGDDSAVSVLIATYRSPESLERVVLEVLDQLVQGDELIVVDDGSDDATPKVLDRLRDPRLTSIIQANQGVSAARNRAASSARNPMLVFLDDDEIPTEGWLEAHRASHRTPGRVVMGRAELVVPARLSTKIVPPPPLDPSDTPSLLVNDSFSVRRSDFEAVGGFDPRFVHGGEDVELGLRLQARGLKLDRAHGAVIRHEIDRSYRDFRRQRLRRGEASLLLEDAHGVALVPRSRDELPPPAWFWGLVARSRPVTEGVCLSLWGVMRLAGLLGSWRGQAAIAGQITAVLGFVGRENAEDMRRD